MVVAHLHGESLHDGIILVDKPAGVTSFGVVDQVRRVLGRSVSSTPEPTPGGRPRRQRRLKCGHAGTLDPLATGLLIIMCGQATRLSPFLMGLDKSYEAKLHFGVGTDTLDAEGRVCATEPVTWLPGDLEALLPRFLGEQQQVPPVFSAIKHQGQPLYKLARLGETIPPLPAKAVHINRLAITHCRWAVAPAAGESVASDGLVYEVTLEVDCSSGTYIRSLARDLAAALGSLGHVYRLRREKVGPFVLANAVVAAKLADVTALAAGLIPPSSALPHLPVLSLTHAEAGRVRQGGQPEIGWLNRLDRPLTSGTAGGKQSEAHFVMVDPGGQLVAVGKLPAEGGPPRSAAVFPAPAGRSDPCG